MSVSVKGTIISQCVKCNFVENSKTSIKRRKVFFGKNEVDEEIQKMITGEILNEGELICRDCIDSARESMTTRLKKGRPSRIFGPSDFISPPDLGKVNNSLSKTLRNRAFEIRSIFNQFEESVPLKLCVGSSLNENVFASLEFDSNGDFSTSTSIFNPMKSLSAEHLLIEKQETHMAMSGLKQQLINRGMKSKWKEVEELRKSSQDYLESSLFV